MRSEYLGKALRFGLATTLTLVVAGAAAVQASAQDYHDNQNHDHDQYHDRNMGHGHHHYNYGGRDYDYVIDNHRGNSDAREVTDRARQSGFQQGQQDAITDIRNGLNRPNPRGHGAYQFALDGWDQEWGYGSTYQRSYRDAYVRGYNEAFAQNHHQGGHRY